jgi:hypothetical protein
MTTYAAMLTRFARFGTPARAVALTLVTAFAGAPALTAHAAPSFEVAGRIDALEGDVTLVRKKEKRAAVVGEAIRESDKLETATGKARVVFVDGSILAIGSKTSVKIRELKLSGGNRNAFFEVAFGKFWTKVAKWVGKGKPNYIVETPAATAGVRGTTFWGDTEVDAICALEGQIFVQTKKAPKAAPVEAVTLTAGNCAADLSKGKQTALAPTADQVSAYLKEVTIAE